MMPRRNTGAKKSPYAYLLFAERQDARSYSVYSYLNPIQGDWRMARDITRCPDCLPLKITTIAFAAALLGGSTPVIAAEQEQVRAVINLIAAVKMPFPEPFESDVAWSEYVRLDGHGETVASMRVDDKVRWCHEHIPHWGRGRRCCVSAMSQWKEYRGPAVTLCCRLRPPRSCRCRKHNSDGTYGPCAERDGCPIFSSRHRSR